MDIVGVLTVDFDIMRMMKVAGRFAGCGFLAGRLICLSFGLIPAYALASDLGSSGSVCAHTDAEMKWRPGSGIICDWGEDGEVWQWCRACGCWVLSTAGFAATNHTYVICHGHANSIDETWIRDIAEALPSRSNVLAVNWGEGADKLLPHDSATCIPDAVERAEWRLRDYYHVRPEQVTFIGHSHGAHIAANIVFDFGEMVPVARFVGLDTSTDEFGVHDGNWRIISQFPFTESFGPDRWMASIKSRCRQVEFYKTSWIMSLSGAKAYGHYNFVVVGADDLPEKMFEVANVEQTLTDLDEIARHSFSHDWFARTIRDPERYAGIGFNFTGNPDLLGQASFCGLIRETVLNSPMGCFVCFSGGNGGTAVMSPRYYDWGKVFNLPSPSIRADEGLTFAGWRCSNGKRYDDGMLVFNLGSGGKTVTMTEIWE